MRIGRTTGYALVLGLVALMSTACNNGSETDMSYKAAINNVAAWENSPEMKTAYPGIALSLGSNSSDNATLLMAGDHWQFTK